MGTALPTANMLQAAPDSHTKTKLLPFHRSLSPTLTRTPLGWQRVWVKPMGLRSAAPHSQKHHSVPTLPRSVLGITLLQDRLHVDLNLCFSDPGCSLTRSSSKHTLGASSSWGSMLSPLPRTPWAGAAQQTPRAVLGGLQLHSPGSHFGAMAVPCHGMPSARRGAERWGPPRRVPISVSAAAPQEPGVPGTACASDCKTAGPGRALVPHSQQLPGGAGGQGGPPLHPAEPPRMSRMPSGVPLTAEEVGRDAGMELWSECGAAPGVGTACHAWLQHGHGCAPGCGCSAQLLPWAAEGGLTAGLCQAVLAWLLSTTSQGSQMGRGLPLGARPHCSEAHIPAAAFATAQCCGTCWPGWQCHGDPNAVSPAQGGKHGDGWRSVEPCSEAGPGLPTAPQGHRDMVRRRGQERRRTFSSGLAPGGPTCLMALSESCPVYNGGNADTLLVSDPSAHPTSPSPTHRPVWVATGLPP